MKDDKCEWCLSGQDFLFKYDKWWICSECLDMAEKYTKCDTDITTNLNRQDLGAVCAAIEADEVDWDGGPMEPLPGSAYGTFSWDGKKYELIKTDEVITNIKLIAKKLPRFVNHGFCYSRY
jgi:hypothetical protein